MYMTELIFPVYCYWHTLKLFLDMNNNHNDYID